MNRIITHGACADGFFSAYIFKKYLSKILNIGPDFQIIGTSPKEMQSGDFEVSETDIVLDLPMPKSKVLFWADHHQTNEPKGETPNNYFWKKTKSNTSFLLEIAESKGVVISENVRNFAKQIDKIDDADYTKEDIIDCFYPLKNTTNLTDLQKTFFIADMIRTRDYELNSILMQELLKGDLFDNPLEDERIWKLNPLMYHESKINNLIKWREWVDAIIEFKPEIKTVIQDDRKTRNYPRGLPDRFYSFMKFPEAFYGLSINYFGDKFFRIGISTNLFEKENINLNVGQLCTRIGQEYGIGTGGGHKLVGSCSVKKENIEEALSEIINNIQKTL